MTKDQAIEVLIAHAKRCPEPEPRERGYPEDVRDDYQEWRERRTKVAEAVAALSVGESPIAKFLEWSTERPTESGNYWLSVHPNKRGSERDAVEYVRVMAYEDGSSFVQRVRHNAICDCKDTTDALFNDSQWTLHKLPSDPFTPGVETPPNSWIDSTERLPENDIVCWVVIAATQEVEVRCFNIHWQCWDDESGDDFMNKIEAVSHWQPLIKPAAPQRSAKL